MEPEPQSVSYIPGSQLTEKTMSPFLNPSNMVLIKSPPLIAMILLPNLEPRMILIYSQSDVTANILVSKLVQLLLSPLDVSQEMHSLRSFIYVNHLDFSLPCSHFPHPEGVVNFPQPQRPLRLEFHCSQSTPQHFLFSPVWVFKTTIGLKSNKYTW